MERRLGFVTRYRYISIDSAASTVEWHRSAMEEAIAFGVVPAIRMRSGEMMIPESVVGGVDRRHVDQHFRGIGAGADALGAEHHGAHDIGVVEAEDDEVAGARRFGDRVCGERPLVG